MTSLVELILVIFVCDSCDSWAVRVVEEIFNNMSSILMFHHMFAAHFFSGTLVVVFVLGNFFANFLIILLHSKVVETKNRPSFVVSHRLARKTTN